MKTILLFLFITINISAQNADKIIESILQNPLSEEDTSNNDYLEINFGYDEINPEQLNDTDQIFIIYQKNMSLSMAILVQSKYTLKLSNNYISGYKYTIISRELKEESIILLYNYDRSLQDR